LCEDNRSRVAINRVERGFPHGGKAKANLCINYLFLTM
jgi:hypothetical protein